MCPKIDLLVFRRWKLRTVLKHDANYCLFHHIIRTGHLQPDHIEVAHPGPRGVWQWVRGSRISCGLFTMYISATTKQKFEGPTMMSTWLQNLRMLSCFRLHCRNSWNSCGTDHTVWKEGVLLTNKQAAEKRICSMDPYKSFVDKMSAVFSNCSWYLSTKCKEKHASVFAWPRTNWEWLTGSRGQPQSFPITQVLLINQVPMWHTASCLEGNHSAAQPVACMGVYGHINVVKWEINIGSEWRNCNSTRTRAPAWIPVKGDLFSNWQSKTSAAAVAIFGASSAWLNNVVKAER